MLLDFTVQNYLSFKEEATISFVAAPHLKATRRNNLAEVDKGKYFVHAVAIVYGANASGKSNLLKAFSDFLQLIMRSHSYAVDTPIPQYKPFRLDVAGRSLPTCFSMEFVVEGTRYKYSVSFDKMHVRTEELLFFPDGRKAVLFRRDGNDKFYFGTLYKGTRKGVGNLVIPNSLLLSRVANLFQEENSLKSVYRYLRDTYKFHFNMDSGNSPVYNTTAEITKSDGNYKKRILGLLNAADLNIEDIKVEEDRSVLSQLQFPPSIPEEIKNKITEEFVRRPFLIHPVYDGTRKVVDTIQFDLNADESTGTVKIYDLASLIINVLTEGGVLVIDEFNSGLHPYISQYVSDLFADRMTNRKNAQLLVTTHDTFMLDSEEIERDQIWFTEKNEFGESRLFSLDEFDKSIVRKNVRFGKWYLDGRFRGVPKIDNNQLELW